MANKIPAEWGELKLMEIESSYHFWGILDKLREECTETSGFWHNRALLLDAFMSGDLYGVRVTGEFKSDARMRGCRRELPCFIWTTGGDDVTIIWVAPEIRRMGIGTFMIEKKNITETPDNIVTSEGTAFFAALEEDGVLRKRKRSALR